MLSCSHENKITRKDANFMKYSKLFSPIKIGSITIKNRFAMAPMGPLGLADANGGWNQRGIDYYVERAKGGTGLIITGVTFFDQVVEKQDPTTVPNPLYKPVNFVKTSREMTERIHAYGNLFTVIRRIWSCDYSYKCR